MKKIIIILLSVYSAVYSQYTEINQNQLTTNGNAIINFKPDQAKISATFIGLGRSFEAALQDLLPKVSKAVNALLSIGLTEDQIETSRFNAAENTKESSWWTSSKDYKIITQVSITVDSLKRLDSIVTVLMKQPVEKVSSISYYLKDIQTKLLIVQKQAAENAKKNAILVAQTLGASIVKPLFIENHPAYNRDYIEVKAEGVAPIIFSNIDMPLSASVRVIYELEYPK